MTEEIKDVDEIIEVPYEEQKSERQYKPLPKDEPMPEFKKEREIERFNNQPEVKINKLKLVDERQYKLHKAWFRLSIIIFSIFALLFLISIVWNNVNASMGKFQDWINTTIINNNNINTEVPINITIPTSNINNNNFTINNNLKIDIDNLTKTELINEISDKIIRAINST